MPQAVDLFASVTQTVLTELWHAVSPSANGTVNNFLGWKKRRTHHSFYNALVDFSEKYKIRHKMYYFNPVPNSDIAIHI